MQDLIRHLPVVIYEYAFYPDGRGAFTYVSERANAILGLKPSDMEGDPGLFGTLAIPSDVHVLEKAFLPGGELSQDEEVQATIEVNGIPKRIGIRYTDELTSEGVVLRRGVIQQVAEGPTAGRLGRYEALLERLPIGVVIHAGGVISFANTHAHMLAKAKPGQLIGMKTLDLVHPDYIPKITSRMKQVVEGQSVPMVEQKFLTMDGGTIDVETIGFPFKYRGRDAIQVIFRDITEKKRAEAQIRKSEALFRQLFQHLPIAVVMLDEMGKVSEVNPGFESMFGYDKEMLRGKNLNDFIVPQDLQSEGIDLNNLIASNHVVSIESIRTHRSGQRINVILYGVPIIQDHQFIGIYGVYVDITDRKRVEEELKVRNTELDNFVYKVSHDLRAPLSSVLGLVNLSRLEGNTDDLRKYMDLIGEKIQALDNFIGDVLSHSKNLKLDVDISQVDLEKIIEQTFADLGYLKEARKVKRSVKVEGIEFYSDRWRISEIFRNLISNAIKYKKPDSDDAEIIIKIHVDHLCADITFADNGIGIKEASLKRIFEMFYRATDKSEGSGIGLYIVKNAVEKLGGEIKVASTLGEGTRFRILLPNRINSILGASATDRT